jgi:hypothetical protein
MTLYLGCQVDGLGLIRPANAKIVRRALTQYGLPSSGYVLKLASALGHPTLPEGYHPLPET